MSSEVRSFGNDVTNKITAVKLQHKITAAEVGVKDSSVSKGTAKGVLTSTVVASTEKWYDRSLLTQHEPIRRDLIALDHYLADQRIENDDWRVVRFFQLFNRFSFYTHHYHDIEEKIYLPWLRELAPGGVIPNDNTKDDHRRLLKEMEAIANMRVQCGVPDDKKECKLIVKNEISKLKNSATFDKAAAIAELREKFAVMKDGMLEHLAEEETSIPPLLRDHTTEKAEAKIVDKIIKSLGITGNRKMLPWVTSAMQVWGPEVRSEFMKTIPSAVRMCHDQWWEKRFNRKYGDVMREYAAREGKYENLDGLSRRTKPLEVVIERNTARGSHMRPKDGQVVTHEIGLGINLDTSDGMKVTDVATGQCMRQGVEVGMQLVGVNGKRLGEVMADVADIEEFKQIVQTAPRPLILNFNKMRDQETARSEAKGTPPQATPTGKADTLQDGAAEAGAEAEAEKPPGVVVKSLHGATYKKVNLHEDLTSSVFTLGTAKVTQFTMKAGGSWEKCIKPSMPEGATATSCPERRVGLVESGAMRVRTDLGFETVIKEGECYVIDPGHQMWVEGDEDLKMLEFESKLGGNGNGNGTGSVAGGVATAKAYREMARTAADEKAARAQAQGHPQDPVGVMAKSFASPDKTMNMGDDGEGGSMFCACVVSLGSAKCMEITAKPGASWAKHVKPELAKMGKGDLESCPARHVGFVKSGAFHITMDDGSTQDLKCGDCYVIGPGHNADVIGSEAGVMVEFETVL